jgi:hypothetical protein
MWLHRDLSRIDTGNFRSSSMQLRLPWNRPRLIRI